MAAAGNGCNLDMEGKSREEIVTAAWQGVQDAYAKDLAKKQMHANVAAAKAAFEKAEAALPPAVDLSEDIPIPDEDFDAHLDR